MSPAAPVQPSGEPFAGDPFSTRDAMLSWIRDIAPYGIFTTDANLVIRDWNEWLATNSGLAAEDVVGRSVLDVFPELVERRLDEHFARALSGNIAVLSTALHKYLLPFPNPVREYDGHHMLQTARIAPLPVNDRIGGTLTIIEDVTLREAQATNLRRQQENDRLLSDALALLIRSEDPLSTVPAIFPQVAASLRIDVYFSFTVTENNELRLLTAGGISPEARASVARLAMNTTLCGIAVRQRQPVVECALQSTTHPEAQHVRRLGLRCYAVFPLLIEDRVLGTLSFGSYARDRFLPGEMEFLGKLTQYLAIATDRARRGAALNQAQARLRAHAGDLERIVAERTARLHETIVQLESFSYTVAHDLRAPIRAMTGFTDILMAEYGGGLPPDANEMLLRLNRAAQRLDVLTRDLLKFSRVARDEIELERVDLGQVVSEIVSGNPRLHGEVVTVVHPLFDVTAQRTLLQQCVTNLCENALKFTRPNVPPRIVIRTELRAESAIVTATTNRPPLISPLDIRSPRRTGPRVRLWIEDNGIGIPEASRDKIWGVFERLPTAASVEGTGIGLAIVARAMQQMGGSCGVESQVGVGSRFWLEFAATAR